MRDSIEDSPKIFIWAAFSAADRVMLDQVLAVTQSARSLRISEKADLKKIRGKPWEKQSEIISNSAWHS